MDAGNPLDSPGASGLRPWPLPAPPRLVFIMRFTDYRDLTRDSVSASPTHPKKYQPVLFVFGMIPNTLILPLEVILYRRTPKALRRELRISFVVISFSFVCIVSMFLLYYEIKTSQQENENFFPRPSHLPVFSWRTGMVRTSRMLPSYCRHLAGRIMASVIYLSCGFVGPRIGLSCSIHLALLTGLAVF
jgi:hypothetical protein